MKKETFDRANKIAKLIEENKKAIEILEALKNVNNDEDHIILWRGHPYEFHAEKLKFEPWEIRLMIYNKKQRIKALEKELEEL